VKRIIIGPSMEKDGKPVVAVNPDLVYLDTSVWIELFQAYRTRKDRLIERIGKAVGNQEYRLLVSTVNFFELIGTSGDISGHFCPESFRALDFVRQTSVLQPPLIPDQEVQRFVNQTRSGVRILDRENLAISSIAEAFQQRKNGNIQWFRDKRRWWDECNERDRALNLDADLYELTGVIAYDSMADMIKARNELLYGPIDSVKARKGKLAQKKMGYKGKKDIPPEGTEIVQLIRHRIDRYLRGKYGTAKVSMVASKLGLVFPGCTRIARDIARSSKLLLSNARKEMPAAYWQAKVDYYNRYYGRQGASGQLGDRNHAVYIPYCSYFGTSDDRIVKALASEFTAVFVEDHLHLFRISEGSSM
jgi:hypothetical protein